MRTIQKYTFGSGDRFGHQGEAQLSAIVDANNAGIPVYPVWNKSFREHSTVGSAPPSVRAEADAAVRALDWKGDYYVDADHIGIDNVEEFLPGSDFFTLDVADYVACPPEAGDVEALLKDCAPHMGDLDIPGIADPVRIDEARVRETADKFLLATRRAGAVYRHITERKGADNFVTEVSIDETDRPQSPVELFLILAMLAREGVPVQTIAPKFTGRFNKGVDYEGDLESFRKEFDEDLCVIAYAIRTFDLPDTLKLSVHSGSDKFSIYPVIRECLSRHGCGLHLKTAGTTWLEELIGLAAAGGDALDLAKRIYREAHSHFDDLTKPYANVIAIDPARLPHPDEVDAWESAHFTAALRHLPDAPEYNPHLRQLLHVGYKVAAKLGETFTDALDANRATIAENVKTNLLDRHIRRVFPTAG